MPFPFYALPGEHNMNHPDNVVKINSLNEFVSCVGEMQPDKKSLDYSLFSMASVALLLVDLVWILVAAAISIFIYTSWLSSQSLDANFSHDFWSAAFVIAVLAPFILYDRRFGAMVSRRQSPSRTRSYVLRFALFGGGLLALGSLCQALNCFPYVWLSIWFATALLLTLLTRVVLFRMVRRLQSRGMLTEVIAVVGAGPVADRLVQALRQTRPDSIELLGVFDDKILGVVVGIDFLAQPRAGADVQGQGAAAHVAQDRDRKSVV